MITQNGEYETGQVVELLEPISLLFRRVPIPQALVFLPGTQGTVIPCPAKLDGLLMIDVDGWPLAVKPCQIKWTGEMVEWQIVSDEEIEDESN